MYLIFTRSPFFAAAPVPGFRIFVTRPLVSSLAMVGLVLQRHLAPSFESWTSTPTSESNVRTSSDSEKRPRFRNLSLTETLLFTSSFSSENAVAVNSSPSRIDSSRFGIANRKSSLSPPTKLAPRIKAMETQQLQSMGPLETCLVVEAFAAVGCEVGDEMEVRLPAGGSVVAQSPVTGPAKFRIVVTAAALDGADEAEALERELEEYSDHEELLDTVVPLRRMLHDQNRAMYLLDFVSRSPEALNLYFLALECAEHRTTTDLPEHQSMIYATYAAQGAPKSVVPSRSLHRAMDLFSERVREPALDALSDLEFAAESTLAAYLTKHHFVESTAYSQILKDAISAVPEPHLDDLLTNRDLWRHARAYFQSHDGSAKHQALLKDYYDTMRWWRRFETRLKKLCATVAQSDRSHAGLSTTTESSSSQQQQQQHTTGKKQEDHEETPSGAPSSSEASPREAAQKSSSFGGFATAIHSSVRSLASVTSTSANNLMVVEEAVSCDQRTAIQVRAELRGAAHKLLLRPPAALRPKKDSPSLLDDLSALLRREKSAFDLDTAAAHYGDIFHKASSVLRASLAAHAWPSFLKHSRQFGEYCASLLDKHTSGLVKLDTACASAVRAAARLPPWNPVFTYSPNHQAGPSRVLVPRFCLGFDTLTTTTNQDTVVKKKKKKHPRSSYKERSSYKDSNGTDGATLDNYMAYMNSQKDDLITVDTSHSAAVDDDPACQLLVVDSGHYFEEDDDDDDDTDDVDLDDDDDDDLVEDDDDDLEKDRNHTVLYDSFDETVLVADVFDDEDAVRELKFDVSSRFKAEVDVALLTTPNVADTLAALLVGSPIVVADEKAAHKAAVLAAALPRNGKRRPRAAMKKLKNKGSGYLFVADCGLERSSVKKKKWPFSASKPRFVKAPARAALALERRLKALKFRALKIADGAADDTEWRRPLDLLREINYEDNDVDMAKDDDDPNDDAWDQLCKRLTAPARSSSRPFAMPQQGKADDYGGPTRSPRSSSVDPTTSTEEYSPRRSLDRFLDDVFFRPLRLFGHKHDEPNIRVAVFRVAQYLHSTADDDDDALRGVAPDSIDDDRVARAEFYERFLSSRRFADALIHHCFR